MTTQITVAGCTLYVSIDQRGSGTVVRLPDQIEASFNSYESLVHLLEGILGRRRWNDYGEQVLSVCNSLLDQ